MEFAGRLNSNGKRMMGILPAQALATTVVVDTDYAWDVPEHWFVIFKILSTQKYQTQTKSQKFNTCECAEPNHFCMDRDFCVIF